MKANRCQGDRTCAICEYISLHCFQGNNWREREAEAEREKGEAEAERGKGQAEAERRGRLRLRLRERRGRLRLRERRGGAEGSVDKAIGFGLILLPMSVLFMFNNYLHG